jgi:zinc protease
MSKVAPIGILLAASILGTACSTRPALISETLGNGMRVLVLEDSTRPEVAVQTWFRSGSVDDPPSEPGLAHAVEHLVFARASRGDRTRFAFTTRDQTAYVQEVAPSSLAGIIQQECGRFAALKPDPEVLRSEKAAIEKEEHDLLASNPEQVIYRKLFELAFDDHPYARPPLGDLARIRNLKPESLIRFHREHYVPSNASLIFVGRTTATEVLPQVRLSCGGGEPAPLPRSTEQPLRPLRIRTATVRVDPSWAGVIGLGFRVLPPDSESTEALALLRLWIGERLRASGLVRRLSVEYFKNEGPSLFSLLMETHSEAQVLEKLSELSRAKPSPEEWRRILQARASEIASDQSGNTVRAMGLAFGASAGPIDHDPADILLMAGRVIRPEVRVSVYAKKQ